MPTSLRLVILAGSLLIIANVLYYIHKRRILMANSTGWVCIALLLLCRHGPAYRQDLS